MNQRRNFMEMLKKFMYGRYGFDQLTQALIILSLILAVITMFFRNGAVILLAYLPFVYAVYRILSKNIYKRSQENLWYITKTEPVKKNFHQTKLLTFGSKTHKYYKCSHCKQIIRVPRGKGKISITCPKCRAEFIKRT